MLRPVLVERIVGADGLDAGGAGPHGALRTMYATATEQLMRARIYQQDRSTTQSGRARAGHWVLVFETPSGPRHDPLTGWLGSGDTQAQVKLTFPTLAAAEAYAEAKGIDYEVRRSGQRTLRIQAYSDNFR